MTGSETVLDALAELKGLPAGTSRFRIWLARPTPGEAECRQVLPVDYMAITRGGSTETNYQLLPGDRLFVGVDPWVVMDGYLAKVTAPIERVFGGILLGNSTVRTFKSNFGNGGNGVGGFGGI
jgi:polysaccharide export outer membrane protein